MATRCSPPGGSITGYLELLPCGNHHVPSSGEKLEFFSDVAPRITVDAGRTSKLIGSSNLAHRKGPQAQATESEFQMMIAVVEAVAGDDSGSDTDVDGRVAAGKADPISAEEREIVAGSGTLCAKKYGSSENKEVPARSGRNVRQTLSGSRSTANPL